MAEIAIFGTLSNKTGEPIARADQVLDPESGKMVSELLRVGVTPGESMTDADVEQMISELFSSE